MKCEPGQTGLQDIEITRAGQTLGHPVCLSIRGVHDLCVVRRPAELHHGHRLWIRRGEVPRVWWPADVHVIGKDITRFHCALWPAMLHGRGGRAAPQVFGHGFVYRKNEATGEVQKLSKSLGNVVEPMDLISQFSSEAFRLYFMSQCPFGGDGEFSFERFTDSYNTRWPTIWATSTAGS